MKSGSGLGLEPLSFTGHAGFGLIPLKGPGVGKLPRTTCFGWIGELTVAFGRPVTITADTHGFLYYVEVASFDADLPHP